MKKIQVIILIFIFGFIIFSACGSSATPKDIARGITGVYKEAMTGLAKIIKNRPKPETVMNKIKTFKEKIIQKLVKLGRARAALSKKDQTSTSWAFSSEVGKLNKIKEYKESWDILNNQLRKYSDGRQYKMSSLISSFHIISQYAFFEILKKDSPEEAKRLGIK